MSLHQNGIGVRILIHRLFQAPRKILLEGRILDDGDAKRIVESQHTLPPAARDTLDLLDVVDLETPTRTLLTFDQERHQNRPLRVGVDGAEGTPLERSQEQRGAVGGLQCERLADVLALRGGILGSGPL